MGRFASTVPFYQRTRQPYGSAFFETVAKTLKFNGEERLLDLGTGPGLLALGFAPFVSEVCGVDPETAMLDAARRNAEQVHIPLHLIEGTTETLSDDVGLFDIVTIGRALHWMDPERTRSTLDRVVTKGGVVLICRASTASDGRNTWLAAYDALRARWSSEPLHVRGNEHLEAFSGSLFEPEGVIDVETWYRVMLDDLADRILSMSSTSPAHLGDRVEGLHTAVRDALSPFARDGAVDEVVKARARVFRASR